MKKTLIALLVLNTISAVASMKGMPDEDPVVNSILNRFKDAHTPTLEELKLGTEWKCRDRSVRRGRFYVKGTKYNFEKFDGFVINRHDSIRTVNMDYVFTASGLQASVKFGSTVGYDTIRIDNDGNLLVEWAVKGEQRGAELEPVGVNVRGAKVVQLSVCINEGNI